FQAEDGIRDKLVTGVQTCALPISPPITLTVASDPVGAMVWLDGIPVGESPAMLGQVARGGHTLRVMAPGFVPIQMGLDVTGAARSEERRVGDEGMTRWSRRGISRE